jgi:hypothetical protein
MQGKKIYRLFHLPQTPKGALIMLSSLRGFAKQSYKFGYLFLGKTASQSLAVTNRSPFGAEKIN